jgi:hypothetical protein
LVIIIFIGMIYLMNDAGMFTSTTVNDQYPFPQYIPPVFEYGF